MFEMQDEKHVAIKFWISTIVYCIIILYYA